MAEAADADHHRRRGVDVVVDYRWRDVADVVLLGALRAAHPNDLTEVPMPEPGRGQVVIKVGGAGACHSDLHLMHDFEAGQLPWDPPFTLGHENARWVSASAPTSPVWRSASQPPSTDAGGEATALGVDSGWTPTARTPPLLQRQAAVADWGSTEVWPSISSCPTSATSSRCRRPWTRCSRRR